MSGKDKVEELSPNPEHAPKDLVIDVPSPDKPGFLRRQDALVRFGHRFEAMQERGTYEPDLISGMVDFLVQFVSVPADIEEAKEVLWELSENQFTYVMQSVQGIGKDDLVPPTSESL